MLRELKVHDLEGGGGGRECDLGALLALRGRAKDLQGRFGVSVAEAHPMLLAVAPDGELQPFAERVDDRDADTVEAAGDLVGVVVGGVLELTTGVELGHDDLGRRDAFRSEEHTSELQSLMRISYAVFCLKKKTTVKTQTNNTQSN